MSSSQDARPDGVASLDSAAVGAFLQSQAACLARGLSTPEAPELIRSVLDQHDASHGDWLALHAQLLRRDPSVAALLAELYAQHGRTAGALERAALPLLPAAARQKVLALHARDLQVRTAAVRAAIAALTATPPQGTRQGT